VVENIVEFVRLSVAAVEIRGSGGQGGAAGADVAASRPAANGDVARPVVAQAS
jgi:hypothetical protein